MPLALGMVMWLPSHRAPFVLWYSPFLSLGDTLFSLAGVSLFGLLARAVLFGGCFILQVFVHGGLVA